MTKRSFIVRIIVMLLLVAIMVPTFVKRVENEGKNKDVVFAYNYNNADMVLSEEEFEESLKRNKENGVNTVSIGEESLNSLISQGYVSAIRYNVLCHKYDDESEEIIKLFEDDRKIHNDSYVLITKRPDVKEYLNKWIPAKLSKNEFVKKETANGAEVYIIYEGIGEPSKLMLGFDENKFEIAKKYGMKIAIYTMVGAYAETKYIEYFSELIDKYDIRMFNLKDEYRGRSKHKDASKNIAALCKLIEEKKLFVVVTEMAEQLSNQKPMGYDDFIESADGRVLRSYETTDYLWENVGPTITEQRYYQIVNSVVDRNLRFVLINQLSNGADDLKGKSEKTDESSKLALEELKKNGYDVSGNYDTDFDYDVNRRLVSAAAIALMILMLLTMLELAFSKRFKKLTLVSYIIAVLAGGITMTAPMGLVLMYPTLFAAIAPCFAITVILAFVKVAREKLSLLKLVISTSVLTLTVLLICGMGQAALLAGEDYYINTLIFRGIKIALLAPMAYSVVLFAVMFLERPKNCKDTVIGLLNSNIKVLWVVIGGALMFVVLTYIKRSGNVSTISSMESFLRNTITDLMMERPRTKEFLVGWPCLVLMVYYMKNTNIKLVQWIFVVGSSILFASVMNSFCHVFTGVATIYARVFNGVLIGIVVCIGAIFVNAIIVRSVQNFMEKSKKNG